MPKAKKSDPRLPPDADSKREKMPPEGVVEYESDAPENDDAQDHDELVEEVVERPRMLVVPEVVAAFPDHELMSTDKAVLACKLTDSERIGKGARLAQLAGDLDEHRANAAVVKADLKDEEKRILKELGETARDIRRGAEDRVIATCVLADYKTNEAKTVRQDTLEVLWSRALTPEERQRVLFPNPNRSTEPDRKTLATGDAS